MTKELMLQKQGVFIPTPTGLVATGNATVYEWRDFGKQLRQVTGAVQWLIGDWLNYGETRYGEKYKEAIEATGYDYQTLANEKQISRRFELSRRRENLSWAHHAEVAGLRPDEMGDDLLKRAENEGWSVKELRKVVKEIKHGADEEEEKDDTPEGWFKFSFIPSDLPAELMQEVAKDRGWHYYAKRQGETLWVYVEAASK
jgi:hypothetical protein